MTWPGLNYTEVFQSDSYMLLSLQLCSTIRISLLYSAKFDSHGMLRLRQRSTHSGISITLFLTYSNTITTNASAAPSKSITFNPPSHPPSFRHHSIDKKKSQD